MHVPVLVVTVALALSAALVFGYLATRLRLSPIVGYLIAGVVIGPHTPGLVADTAIAADLAEIGVALLMFGVGLHFSPRELASVRAIAIPGALVQSAVATGLGVLVGVAWGWGAGAGLVLGLAVSVASTVVLVRGLEDSGLLLTPSGRTAVGWLIVEDLLTVLILVVLPTVSGALGGIDDGTGTSLAVSLAWSALKVGTFIALVLVVGRRLIPWALDRVARARSSELFTLCVLGIALGIACGASYLTGVSLALGAFVGGMVVGQTDLSHQAAADSIPLRSAFAVLFFVSVGMLFDPGLVHEAPGLLAATLGIILIAKPLAALGIVLAFGHPLRLALAVAAGLAQVGEFSFILAKVGGDLGLLPQIGHDAVLAGALVSITLNPLLFRAVAPLDRHLHAWPPTARLLARLERQRGIDAAPQVPAMSGHVVLCGSGRVGTVVGRLLARRSWPTVIIEGDRARAARLRARGLQVVDGDAASRHVLAHAGVENAALLVISYSDAFSARLAIDHARRLNPGLPIVVRVQSRTERDHLEAIPGVQAVMGEFEAAAELGRRALIAGGAGTIETEAIIRELRRADRGEEHDLGSTLVELPVSPGSRADGVRVVDLRLPPSARIVVVRRGTQEVIARGDTVLRAGDLLLVLGDPDAHDQVLRLIKAADQR